MDRVAAIAREGLKKDIPMFAAGDTLRVMVRVREGDKERLQAFEGVCVSRRGGGIDETFTVRKLSAGVGVSSASVPGCNWSEVRSRTSVSASDARAAATTWRTARSRRSSSWPTASVRGASGSSVEFLLVAIALQHPTPH